MLLLLSLLLKYRAFLLSELRESRLRSASWRSAGHVWTKLLVELVICGLCCPIGVSWTWYVNPTYIPNGDGFPNGVPESIDGIIACAMMLRLVRRPGPSFARCLASSRSPCRFCRVLRSAL